MLDLNPVTLKETLVINENLTLNLQSEACKINIDYDTAGVQGILEYVLFYFP